MKTKQTKDPELCDEKFQPTKFQRLMMKLAKWLYGKKPKSLYMMED